MTKPGYITPRDLLISAATALDNWPESMGDEHDTRPQHPEDALATALTVLGTTTALLVAEVKAARD